MKHVLVAYATRMGSTAEIAQAIGHELTRRGLSVTVSACTDAGRADRFDAVIVGSAVYIGHWDGEAVDYLKSEDAALSTRPTWLFQSGPCGEGARDEQIAVPHTVLKAARRLGVEAPVTFGGRLQKSTSTGPISRWLATGALAGDFRDWDRIRAWASDKADQLLKPPSGASPELSAALGDGPDPVIDRVLLSGEST
jgi:menaquinone-dependent protoporphyrinogen oxidase